MEARCRRPMVHWKGWDQLDVLDVSLDCGFELAVERCETRAGLFSVRLRDEASTWVIP